MKEVLFVGAVTLAVTLFAMAAARVYVGDRRRPLRHSAIWWVLGAWAVGLLGGSLLLFLPRSWEPVAIAGVLSLLVVRWLLAWQVSGSQGARSSFPLLMAVAAGAMLFAVFAMLATGARL